MHAPRRCLEFFKARSFHCVSSEPIAPGSLFGPFQYTETSEHTSSRLFRLFTCQRASSYYAGGTYRFTTDDFFLNRSRLFSNRSRLGEGDHNGRSAAVNWVSRKFFRSHQTNFQVETSSVKNSRMSSIHATVQAPRPKHIRMECQPRGDYAHAAREGQAAVKQNFLAAHNSRHDSALR